MVITASTKNDAVNFMLLAIGQEAVVWADSNNGPQIGTDDGKAKFLLELIARQITSREWYWNTQAKKLLAAETVGPSIGKILVPANVAKLTYPDDKVFESTTPRIAERNGVVWNITDNTDQWGSTGSLELKLVYYLDWIEFPQSARDVVTLRAAFDFVKGSLGPSSFMAQMLGAEALEAFKELNADNNNFRVPGNNLFQSPDVARGVPRREVPIYLQ